MTRKKVLWLIIVSIVLLLMLQTLTFYTIGRHQLRNHLLSGDTDLSLYPRDFDTVFVRDFHIVECMNIGHMPLSHHLKEHAEMMERKLQARHIIFQDHSDRTVDHRLEKTADLVYHTSMEYPAPFERPTDFTVRQIEWLLVDQEESVRREVTYRWWLFTWTPQYEFVKVIPDRKTLQKKRRAEYLKRNPEVQD